MADQTRRDYYERRRSGLKSERSSFDAHYKELSQFVKPRQGRFELTDRNKGTKKHQNIINSRATRALRIATAGMFAGNMSPAKPWFELVTENLELMQFQPVKEWLQFTARQMRAIFNASNLYSMAPTMLSELLLFGTGSISHEDDSDTLARFYAHTVGSYMISQNAKFQTDTLVREFEMTAEQMAGKFGIENLSMSVRNALDKPNPNMHQWFPVVQFIEPNDEFRPNSPFSKFKKWSSVHYEPGNREKEMFLSEKGFDEFPNYSPRWEVTGEDVYGTDCPGMTALGDIKQLQTEEKRKGQGIEKQVNPPLTGPPGVRNVPVSSLPGGLNIYQMQGTQKLEALYNVQINLADLTQDIQEVERRIDAAFMVELWLAISEMEGIQPRNQLELAERNSERLLQVGPVLERIQGDVLDPLINRTFNQMRRADLLMPIPPELQDQELRVNYVSSLAQAQRAVDTKGITRLSDYVAFLVSQGLSDGRKLDGDAAITEYADLIGTPPRLIASDKDVAAEREQEAQQQAAAANLEAAKTLGQAAGSAGQVNLEEDNPVSRLANAGS